MTADPYMTLDDHIRAAERHVAWHRSGEDIGTVGLRCAVDSLSQAFSIARKSNDHRAMSRICGWRNQLRAHIVRIEPWRKPRKRPLSSPQKEAA